MYGLKKTPRTWNKIINNLLIKLGFNKYTSERGVYVKGSNEQNQMT